MGTNHVGRDPVQSPKLLGWFRAQLTLQVLGGPVFIFNRIQGCFLCPAPLQTPFPSTLDNPIGCRHDTHYIFAPLV